MPELPEVEAARSLLQRSCVGEKITVVSCDEQGGGPRDGLFDDIVFDGVSADEFENALLNRVIAGVMRKGKYHWLELNGTGATPLFHFGMSGKWHVKGLACIEYVDVKSDTSGLWPPRFTKLLIKTEDGTEAAFTCPRRIGRIRLRSDVIRERPVSELGHDPLTEMPAVKTLVEYFTKRSKPVKAVLLDQEGVVAGVGNWVADEVLFQARVHPSTPCNRLPLACVQALHTSLYHVVKAACAVEADSSKFPHHWLFHYRWAKRKAGPAATYCNGEEIHFSTVSGRTTATVPSVQGHGPTLQPFEGEIPFQPPLEEVKSIRDHKRGVVKKEGDVKDDGDASTGGAGGEEPKENDQNSVAGSVDGRRSRVADEEEDYDFEDPLVEKIKKRKTTTSVEGSVSSASTLVRSSRRSKSTSSRR